MKAKIRLVNKYRVICNPIVRSFYTREIMKAFKKRCFSNRFSDKRRLKRMYRKSFKSTSCSFRVG